MEQPTQTQALARQTVIEGEIVDAGGFNTKIAEWQRQGFNVLTPVVTLNSIPRDHRIVVNRIAINPDPGAGEVFANPLFCKSGEVALSKVGLEKVAQCAGISITESVRVDSGTVPHLYSYRVTGRWTGFDGNTIARQANKTLDLRDGSNELKGFQANQIDQTRRHGEAICESKAINRLYRMYGLRQKYTQRELAERPFIVLKLQWEPDMTNPVVAALVTQMRMGAERLLFPQVVPVDPSTLAQHQLPPDLRQATTEVLPDEDEQDAPYEITATPAAAKPIDEPTFLVEGVYKSGDAIYCRIEGDEAPVWIQSIDLANAAKAAATGKRRVVLTIEVRGEDRVLTRVAEAL